MSAMAPREFVRASQSSSGGRLLPRGLGMTPGAATIQPLADGHDSGADYDLGAAAGRPQRGLAILNRLEDGAFLGSAEECSFRSRRAGPFLSAVGPRCFR